MLLHLCVFQYYWDLTCHTIPYSLNKRLEMTLRRSPYITTLLLIRCGSIGLILTSSRLGIKFTYGDNTIYIDIYWKMGLPLDIFILPHRQWKQWNLTHFSYFDNAICKKTIQLDLPHPQHLYFSQHQPATVIKIGSLDRFRCITKMALGMLRTP